MKVSELIEELQKAQKEIPELGDAEVKLGLNEYNIVSVAGVENRKTGEKAVLLLDTADSFKAMLKQLTDT